MTVKTTVAQTRRAEALLITRTGLVIVEELRNELYPQNYGKLRCPGGKIEAGETPRDTVIRELQEEYGLQISPADIIMTLSENSRTTRLLVKADDSWVGKVSDTGCEVLRRQASAPELWVRD